MALKASQPLLALLPSALGTYFAEHVGGLEGRALDRVKPVRYLRDNYEARVSCLRVVSNPTMYPCNTLTVVILERF